MSYYRSGLRKLGYNPLIFRIANSSKSNCLAALGWNAGEDENDRRLVFHGHSCSETILSASDYSSQQYQFNRDAYANSKHSIQIGLQFYATPLLLCEEDSINFRFTALFSSVCLFFTFIFFFSQKIHTFNQALHQWLVFFLSVVYLVIIWLVMYVETIWIA